MIVAADKAMYRRKAVRRITPAELPSLTYTVLPERHDVLDDNLIVELDESHVVASAAVH
jgi:hypothetical protein